MDNVCHTLAGAAFGRAGLARRTQLGSATLMIAANLPDLDVLVFATSTPAVAFRRGWTHGTLAQLLLPVALALVMLVIGRARRGDQSGPPLSLRWLIALSYVGVISHVLMDLLNNYGVRLFAPLDWRWYYGDSVFIIDPWLWLTLGLGVWAGRRMRRPDVAARAALVVALIYVEAMVASSRGARAHVINVWQEQYGAPPPALMVGPAPVTPFTRQVIVDAGNHYETGTFSWFPMRVRFDPVTVPKNDDDPRVVRARAAPNVRAFLVWSRFPFWTLESVQGGTRVSVSDMRFITRGGGFTQSVVVPDLIANPD
jgi:inner membrane protein